MTLHWLPVRKRVAFISCLVCCSLSSTAPSYLTTDCHCQLVSDEARRRLRSVNSRRCVIRHTDTASSVTDVLLLQTPSCGTVFQFNGDKPMLVIEQLKQLLKTFYQRVSQKTERRNVECPSVCLSVRLSVTLRYCIKTKKVNVTISSPPESPIILVSGNIRFITKFERGHPERGQFMRLGWVRTGDFGEFSTNKLPYLRNGAR